MIKRKQQVQAEQRQMARTDVEVRVARSFGGRNFFEIGKDGFLFEKETWQPQRPIGLGVRVPLKPNQHVAVLRPLSDEEIRERKDELQKAAKGLEELWQDEDAMPDQIEEAEAEGRVERLRIKAAEEAIRIDDEDGWYEMPVTFFKAGESHPYVPHKKVNHLAILVMDENGVFTRTMVGIIVRAGRVYVRMQETLQAKVVRTEDEMVIVPTTAAPLYEGVEGFRNRWVNTRREACGLAVIWGVRVPKMASHTMPIWEQPTGLREKEGHIAYWYELGGFGEFINDQGRRVFFHFSNVETNGSLATFFPGDRVRFQRTRPKLKDGKPDGDRLDAVGVRLTERAKRS